MKPLKEGTAWRKVAEAFATPWVDRTAIQRTLTVSGLCAAMSKLLPSLERYEWYERLGSVRRGRWWSYQTVKSDANRAVFAGLMAAMSQRERDAFFEQ